MKPLYDYLVEFRNLIGVSGPDDMSMKYEEERNIEILVKCAESLGLKNIQWEDQENSPHNTVFADRYAKVIIGDPKKEVCLYVQIWGGSGPIVDFLDNLGKEDTWVKGKSRIPDSWRINADRMRRRGDVEGACIYALKNAMKLQPKLEHIPDKSFQGR